MCPYVAPPSGSDTLSDNQYSVLQLGYSNGGYGQYNLSGGSVGVNAIFVGGSTESATGASASPQTVAREYSTRRAAPSAPSARAV